VITAGAIFELLGEARRRRLFSIVSCQQVREDGSPERPYGHFLTPLSLTGWLRGLAKIGLWKPLKKAVETDDFIYPEWVSGSVIMIQRDSLTVLGGWDEDFWMYFEDVDLCKRAIQAGGEIVLMKRCCVEHNHGGSSRINTTVTALTKSEVNISRHVYISKHEVGFKAAMMHAFLIINNLLIGFIPAIIGLFLFFVRGLFASANSYFQLAGYYARRLKSRTWLSHRSINYSKV
jgi:GT2 family glycosyltransferase